MKTRYFIFAAAIMLLLLQGFTGNTLIGNQVPRGTDYFMVNGKIIDSESEDPIVFANVYIEGTGIGTVSNTDGAFELKVPVSKEDKNLNIAYIGYKNHNEPLADLRDKPAIIPLQQDPVKLDEVKVRTNEPTELLRAALRRIPENYSIDPAMLTAFYRETIRQNRHYVSVSEAVLDIYKAPYKSDFSFDRVKIFKGRKSQDVKKMDTLVMKLQGGPKTSVLLDVVKNPANLLSGEYLEYYDYTFEGIVSIDERQNYKIKFDQKDNLNIPLYSGRIYLDMDNLAISRLEFMLSEKGIEWAAEDLVTKKPANLDVEVDNAQYLVKYRELDGRWYLNHVRSELNLSLKWDRKLFRSKYTIMFEMAVTDKSTENIHKIKFSEAAKLSDVLTDQVDYFQDEEFWGDYNTIKPDETIEAAIERLSRRLRREF